MNAKSPDRSCCWISKGKPTALRHSSSENIRILIIWGLWAADGWWGNIVGVNYYLISAAFVDCGFFEGT